MARSIPSPSSRATHAPATRARFVAATVVDRFFEQISQSPVAESANAANAKQAGAAKTLDESWGALYNRKRAAVVPRGAFETAIHLL